MLFNFFVHHCLWAKLSWIACLGEVFFSDQTGPKIFEQGLSYGFALPILN